VNTAISDSVMAMTAKLISSIAFNAACHRRHAFLDVTEDGFEHHDGVIDHHADDSARARAW
jgi:hypothetical protein